MRLPSSNLILLAAILIMGVMLCFLNLSHLRHGTSALRSLESSLDGSLLPWSTPDQVNSLAKRVAPASSLSLEASVQAEKLEEANLKIDKLTRELEEATHKLQEKSTTTAESSRKADTSVTKASSAGRMLSSYPPVCQFWMKQMSEDSLQQSATYHHAPSALSLWNAHLPVILQHSRHINDHNYVLHDFTAHLLQLVSDRLVNSVKTVPRLSSQWDRVERILDVIRARVEYLQSADGKNTSTTNFPPRKLRIVIMGGSLLVGVNCRKVIPELKLRGLLMPNRLCTWSSRLEQFLNNILGGDVVTVDKIAVGGTNSGTGRTILDYELMPHSHPDILINAYSTNDMHVTTVQQAAKSNQTLGDKVLELTQDFVRAALNPSRSGGCRPRTPLLLHMDDYLGNEQREIWSTTELSRGVQALANYYGFTSMSYADVVRDLVYGQTRERWMSPNGWYNDQDEFEREIHPSMAMHITAMWVTVFNLLNLATTYCGMHHSARGETTGAIVYHSGVGGMPEIVGKNIPGGKPEHPPLGLPPRLTKHLNLEFVSNSWRNSSHIDVSEKECTDDEMEAQETKRCPFAWVSDLSQQMKDETWIKALFEGRTVENVGWELLNDHGKLGYVPKEGGNATLVLDFASVTRPIRVVTLFYMKSYGDDWSPSLMRLALSRRDVKQNEWESLHQEVLSGVHDKTTSETYTLEHILRGGGVPTGSDFRISLTMFDGSKKFKLQGLAVCS